MFDITQFIQPLFLLKIGLVVMLGLYTIFALVLVNQIRVMNRILIQRSVEFFIELIAILHLLVAFSLFVATIVIL